MNKKISIILMLLCIPMVVYATSFSYDDAVKKVNTFHEQYYDSEKYILPVSTGLLTKEEYEITRPKGDRKAFSYIYDGQDTYLSNMESFTTRVNAGGGSIPNIPGTNF